MWTETGTVRNRHTGQAIRELPRRASRVDLSDADLVGADLAHWDFRAGKLPRANLRGADLRWTNFGSVVPFWPVVCVTLGLLLVVIALLYVEPLAGLFFLLILGPPCALLIRPRRANLEAAILADADLARSDLAGAVLRDADLRGADLTEANLREADLRGAKLEGANLTGALYNQGTRWPEGFDPEAAGARFQDWRVREMENLVW